MKLFIDTHDKNTKTFPEKISADELKKFYEGYVKIFQEEGVVIVRTLLNPADGRAFCLNMAESAEQVERAHQRVGLPYDSITEVKGVAPNDLLYGI
jgi:hypothetical protein